MLPTLELTLQRKTESGYPVIAALTRPGGFLPLRREGMLNLDISALAELQYDPLAYGTALGQALFVDEIRDTFVKALGDEPLRVLLSVEAPDLRTLDWHRLAAPFDGHWRFLASQQNTPFSLSIPSPASAHFPALGRRDLRALVLVAGPESLSGDYKLAPFDVPATIAGIQSALGDIPCDILPNPSLDALCAALTRGVEPVETKTPYTLLHLVCHGAVNQNGETILYFPKDERRSPTPATDLLNRLGSLARLPHFVFLSACESALPQNGLGSLAGRLVRELGLPAVLAMTDRVSIATAGAIAAPFYAHLYQHGQPDLALAQSLAGLQGAHDLTVPAIFSRLGDRPLFDDNSERALTEKELEFGLAKLEEALAERAPVMDSLRDTLTRRLRSTLGALVQSLSESRRTERKESLDRLNSLSLEALDLSFNALCLGQTPPAYDSRSPFRGLESFRPEDAPYFFGREALTKRLVQKLNEHNFLAVLGASGSGKSSLVMAGLVPALIVPYAVFRPGAEPLSELEKALQAGPQLLVVDQFEELFTLSAREQRSDFISRLLEQSHRLRVVITLRADFLGEVAPFKSLKDEVQNHQEIIPPMDEAELRRAMEGQAGCAGLRFESDLSKQMLDDVAGEPGAMPLLQHALWTLWTRRHGRWLRAEEYRAFGGVRQAIASTAEAVFARCSEFEKERLRDIFLRLTRLDEGTDGRDTRRRVLLRDLIPADSEPAATTLLIKQLADARLVVVTGDEVEVAHEALIRHWERLRAWLNDDRDNLRLREGVSEAANAWRENPKNADLLIHRGGRLEDALKLRATLNMQEQTYLEACKTSVQKRRRATIASISFAVLVVIVILVGWGWTSNENSKMLGYQVATSDAAKATAIGEANIRATAQAESEQKARISRARELYSYSLKTVDEPFSSIKRLLLTLEAIKISQFSDPQFISLQATISEQLSHIGGSVVKDPRINSYMGGFSSGGNWLLSGNALWTIRDSHPNAIEFPELQETKNVTLSPSERWLAETGDTKITIRDTQDSSTNIRILDVQELKGQQGSFFVDSFFSPDEHWLVGRTVSPSLAYIWNIQEPSMEPYALYTEDEPIYQLNFSKDGNLLVSNSRIWKLDGNTIEPFNVNEQTNNMYGFTLSSYGRWLAGIDRSNTELMLWDMDNLSSKPLILETPISIYFIQFSPDEHWLAGRGGGSQNISIWNLQNLSAPPLSLDVQDQVNSLIFSPDGRWVVTLDLFHTMKLWNLGNTQNLPVLISDQKFVNSIAFSDKGQLLATGSKNGSIYFWDLQKTTLSPIILTAHEGSVDTLDFSPDDSLLVSISDDKTIRIWNTLDMVVAPVSLNVHGIGEGLMSFSPDGSRLAVSDSNSQIFLLDIQYPSEKAIEIELESNTSQIYGLAFSPDGKKLIVINSDENNQYENVSAWYVKDNPIRLFALPGREKPDILFFTYQPSGNWLASSCLDGTIKLWNIDNLQAEPLILQGQGNIVNFLAISNNGQRLVSWSGDDETNLFLWSLQNPSDPPIVLQGLKDFAREFPLVLYISKSGIWLAARCGQFVCLWNSQQLNSKPIFLEHYSQNLLISPDENWLVSSGVDDRILLWNMNKLSATPIILQKLYDVYELRFSQDSQWLAVSGFIQSAAGEFGMGYKEVIGFWNIRDLMSEPIILDSPSGAQIAAIAANDNGQLFSSIDVDGNVYLWDMNLERLTQKACQVAGRNFTRAEWAQYFPYEEYRATCPQWPLEPEPTATPSP